MSEYQPSAIRVSDSEREDALAKLGEHMSAGRLDIDEYGERSAKVATAKTRGELLGLFGDLPEPKPTFGQPVPRPAGAPPRPKTTAEKVVPIVAVVLICGVFAALKLPFFIPFLILFLVINNGRGHHRPRGRGRVWQERG
ncbi:DUF1707 domain-containing protein [Actinophytocola sp.]|uniref:DUF1707 SHOCT-like domain-containing protein n=1 Tax=Actinophytocola sp. TaxID=1872138 RepID=UPI002ED14681